MLSSERNEQAAIIWSILFEAELKALLHHESETIKAKYIMRRLIFIKGKKWAYKSLKIIAKSGKISTYVDSIGKEITRGKNILEQKKE